LPDEVVPLSSPIRSSRSAKSKGSLFRIERRGPEFFARRISRVAIFACESGRDEVSE
jgi:hypothetical protein